MPYGQFLRSPFPLTNGYPIKTEDSSINPNTVFLYDAGYVKSWPKQGNPVNNDLIKNLVTGGPDSKVVKGDPAITFEQGGFKLVGLEGTHIEVGSSTDFELATLANPDVIFFVWVKRLTDVGYGGYPAILGRGAKLGGPPPREFYINLGSDGRSIVIGFVNSSGALSELTIPTGSAALTAYRALYGQTVQICGAIEGSKLKIFINGVLIATSTDNFTKPFANLTDIPIRIGFGSGGHEFQGIIKRWGMTKLDSTYTASVVALKDYADNHERLNPS